MTHLPPEQTRRPAYAPRPSEADEMNGARGPIPPKATTRRLPYAKILIGLATALAVGICGWCALVREDADVESEPTSRTIVTLVRPLPDQTLADVCAAYGVPERLCSLSDQCNARSPRRDGRIPLILRGDGEDCGTPPP